MARPVRKSSSKSVKKSASKRSTRSSAPTLNLNIAALNPLALLGDVDVVGGVTGTLRGLTSVRGVKALLEKWGAYGAGTMLAYSSVAAARLGGSGPGAMNKALGLASRTGPLRDVADLWFGPWWAYAQFLLGLIGIFSMAEGSDLPALYTGISLALFANTSLAGSVFGVRETIIRNAMAFTYSNAITLLLTTARFRSFFSAKQQAALRKLCAVVPGLMMNFLFMQGASMAKFNAAGLTGPGVLGPVAGLIFHPLHGLISTLVILAYFSGFSQRRAATYMWLEHTIVGVSLAPQLVEPYGAMLSAMHLGIASTFMAECVPRDSLIPKLF